MELHLMPSPVHLLRHAAPTITETWARALVDPTVPPLLITHLHQHLAHLTDQLLTVLLAESLNQDQAEAIGQELARLPLPPATCLGDSLVVIGTALLAALDPTVHAAVLQRLPIVQGAIAAGFVTTSRAQALQASAACAQSALPDQQAMTLDTLPGLDVLARVLPLACVLVDSRGIVTYATGQAFDALQATPEMLLGRSIYTFLPISPEGTQYFAEALAGIAQVMIVPVHDRVFCAHFAPLTTEDGQIAGVFALALDITALPSLAVIPNQPGNTSAHAEYSIASTPKPHPEQHLPHNSPLQAAHTAPAELAGLTTDELGLIELLAHGQTNRQISQAIGIGEKAVEKRLAKLFAKLGVTTRTEAAVRAVGAR